MRNLPRRLSRAIAGFYSGRRLAVLLLLTAAFFWLINFSAAPISVPSFLRATGNHGYLDLMPFYSAAQAYASLAHYGAPGRELYLRFLMVDLAYISMYVPAFALLFTGLIRARPGTRDALLWLNLLPLLAGLFDCIEDGGILAMLTLYPHTSWAIATLSGLATAAKWATAAVSMLCLAWLGGSLLRRGQAHSHSPVARTSVARGRPDGREPSKWRAPPGARS